MVGKDLREQVHPLTHTVKPISNPCLSKHYICFFLNAFRDGDFTTSLLSLLQCLKTLSVEKFFLVFSLDSCCLR